MRAGLAALPRLGVRGEWWAGDPGSTETLPVPARGEVVDLGRATVLEGTGPAAAGSFATREDRSGRALAVTGCVSPRARWWFAGAGAALDHESVLSLTNVVLGLVPLVSLVFGTMYLYHAREFIQMMLAQPVGRRANGGVVGDVELLGADGGPRSGHR